MNAGLQHLFIAEAAAVVSAFILVSTSGCDAQSFAMPGRVMRTNAAPTQDVPLPPKPSKIPAAQFPRTDLDWGRLFKEQVERCWKMPAGSGREPVEAIFSIRLKRDGWLEDVRMISSAETTPYGKAYQASSFRAITDCQPYDLPQGAYDQWRYFEPVFIWRTR